jgi:PAS domain S-box-containing protein
MLEDLQVIVWESDGDLRVRYVSGRAATLFGYPVSEWVGSSAVWGRVVHPEDLAEFVAAAGGVAESGQETEVEFRALNAGGGELWVRALLGSIPAGRGGARLRGVMLDVTDRRHAEASARQYAERMRRLLDHSADPLLVHDENGRIAEANRAACEALGYSRRELLEMRIGDVEAGVDEGSGAAWKGLVPGRSQVGDGRCVRRDGTSLVVERYRSLFEWEGRPLFVVRYRDMTEQRQLEEQLRQSQKMEEMGRLTGGLAHDFHNMLTAIKGHAELLLQRTGADAQREDLEQIAQAADRATVLTRKLLAFSRRRVMTPEPVDLNGLVLETTHLLRPLIGEQIELETRLAADGTVRGDPSQLEQVLVNLVVNARDAMAAGGQLRVSTANLTVEPGPLGRYGFVKPGRYVSLEVEDTGHGMDEATLARVFEPFFTTKAVDKGSGLGLSTAYGIVKDAGGYILAESEPGRGSRFTVLLPWSAEAAAEAGTRLAAPPPRAAAVAERTVLIVEDEPAVRSLIRRILEREGHRVLEAMDGEHALAASRASDAAIDLLITDVRMPGLGGPALTRILQAERPGLRVILTSGYGDDIAGGGSGPGAPLFLEKPFSPDQLVQVVREALATPPHDLVPDAPTA